MNKVSERPGLGAEPVPVGCEALFHCYISCGVFLVALLNLPLHFSLQQRKKKEPVVWDHATYKQAVRKAMFARFKELE